MLQKLINPVVVYVYVIVVVKVIGSLVEFYGYIEFSDNRVGDYTALEMLSFAQIRIHEGLQLLFTGNKGE